MADHREGKSKANKRKAASEGAGKIREFLFSLDILAVEELSWPQCKFKNPLRFDFAVIVDGGQLAIIEFDGAQHFNYVSSWHKSPEGFENSKRKDIIKNRFLRERKIPLLRIAYPEEDHIAKHVTEYLTELRKGHKITRFIPSSLYPHPYGEEDDKCTVQ